MIFERRATRRALVALFLVSRSLYAQQPSPQEKAAAEALFQSGADLIEQAHFLEACEKFEASYALDPALGTRLRLADCYDRTGRTASAWALFTELVAMARAQGQSDREAIAAVRVTDLEARLSKLTVRLELERRAPDLTLKLNGSAIPAASWGVPIPVDPGTQTIEATAPGYKPWSARIEVKPGPSSQSVDVPPLELEPRAAAAETTTPKHVPATVREPAPRALEDEPRPLIWAGAITGGVGLIGVGVAGILAYRAYDKNRDSLDGCSSADANACTPDGKHLRDEAQQFARASTVAAIAGGTLLATGVTLLILAPPAHPRASADQLRFQAFAAPGAARLQVQGAF